MFTLYCKRTIPFLHSSQLVMHMYRISAAVAPSQFFRSCILWGFFCCWFVVWVFFFLEEYLVNGEEQRYFYRAASFEIALL